MRLVGRNAAMSAFGVAPTAAAAAPQGDQFSPRAGDFFSPALEDRLRTMEANIEGLARANNALVGENAKLKKSLRGYAAHFAGLVRTLKVSYTPDVQIMTPQPSQRTNAPTQPVSPGAQVVDAVASPGAPPAGPPQTAAQQVSAAADRLFYGDGESAFYSGGEDD